MTRRVEKVVETPVADSFRVQQVGGMFDVSIEEKSRLTFAAEVPDDDDWQIGVIVGPSGSGKSTIAAKAFGEMLYHGRRWPRDKAVVDAFPAGLSIKEITAGLTAVGFSSPPAWVRPYRVLSNGEQFRVDLAMALLSRGGCVAFDEFTSVVDRTVAKIGSAAVAKAVRKGRVRAEKFIAVTCHYDVLEWLEPDWILDMATAKLTRRRLRRGGERKGWPRRPEIRLEVRRCKSDLWGLFARHHYLDAGLHRSAQCYVATWNEDPVCFVAVLPCVGMVGRRRISRIVTLPDYQGVGIGGATLAAVAEIWTEAGARVSITTSHPAMIRSLENRATWRTMYIAKQGGAGHVGGYAGIVRTSCGRSVVGFEYVGTENKRLARGGGATRQARS